MPYLSIQTNVSIEEKEQQEFLHKASGRVSELLGKPEQYVMVVLDAGLPMLFAGHGTPAAYLNLKSLGLPAERTAELSAALCKLVQDSLNIEQSRIYIGFDSPDRCNWGWDGQTF